MSGPGDQYATSLPGIGSKAREHGPNIASVEGHDGINLSFEKALS